MGKKSISRNRGIYIILTGIVMVLGLLSRKVEGLPDLLSTYSGDVLWAMMVYLGFAVLFKYQSIQRIVLMALVFTFGIECSQLYQAPWINQIRATTIGGLVLGYGFLWTDLVCYMIGIGLGSLVDRYYKYRMTRLYS